MKRLLLKIWYLLPFWLQRLASRLIRPHFQVAAGAMIFNARGQLLLCEHTYRRGRPWGLPGGNLKFGEDPADGLRRELREETGFEVENLELLLVENSRLLPLICLTYLCAGVHGSFVASDEVASVRYFDTDKLPDFYEEQGATIRRALAILAARTTHA